MAGLHSVTDLLEQGDTPEELLGRLLGDLELSVIDRLPAHFHCNCSKERVKKALFSLGAKELKEMIEEAKPIEVNCQFCNSSYQFTPEELKEIIA